MLLRVLFVGIDSLFTSGEEGTWRVDGSKELVARVWLLCSSQIIWVVPFMPCSHKITDTQQSIHHILESSTTRTSFNAFFHYGPIIHHAESVRPPSAHSKVRSVCPKRQNIARKRLFPFF